MLGADIPARNNAVLCMVMAKTSFANLAITRATDLCCKELAQISETPAFVSVVNGVVES